MTNSNIEMDAADASPTLKADPIVAGDVTAVALRGDEERESEQQADAARTKKELEVMSESEIPRKEVIRVLLWTAPRSLSTAFERCMTRVPRAKIFNEMYGAAFLLGPDRKVRWYPKLTPKHSYKHCKERLEAEHSGYDFVFAKDFAFEVHHHTDMLPKGYMHTFLVRHPYKVFTSLRTMLCRSVILRCLSRDANIKMCFPTDGYFFQDMWELYKYLRDHPDYPVPTIIDADDLIRDPDAMIMKYCETIGLPFHPDILRWEKAELKELPWEGPKFFHFMNKLIGCYTNALNSTGFRKGGFKKDTRRTADVKSKTKSSSNRVDVADTGKAQKSGDSDRLTAKDAPPSPLEAVTPVQGLNNGAFTPEGAEEVGTGLAATKRNPSDKEGACASTIPEFDLSNLHSDVRKAIEYTMPFYKLLYERRITLDS